MKKRILSLLMIVCMVFGFLKIFKTENAFAESKPYGAVTVRGISAESYNNVMKAAGAATLAYGETAYEITIDYKNLPDLTYGNFAGSLGIRLGTAQFQLYVDDLSKISSVFALDSSFEDYELDVDRYGKLDYLVAKNGIENSISVVTTTVTNARYGYPRKIANEDNDVNGVLHDAIVFYVTVKEPVVITEVLSDMSFFYYGNIVSGLKNITNQSLVIGRGIAKTNSTSNMKSYIRNLYLSENWGDNSYNILTEHTAVAKGSTTEMLIQPTIIRNGENIENLKVYLAQPGGKIIEIDNWANTIITPGTTFKEGKNIYVILKNTATGQSSVKLTKLRIVSDRVQGDSIWSGNLPSVSDNMSFKLGKKIGITIPEDVPVFGGSEIDFDIGYVPISIEYSYPDKLNVVFGANIATQKGEKDKTWGDVKYFKDFNFEKYKSDFKKAMSKGGRTLKQLRNDYRMTNKIPLKSLKNISGNIDIAGYAQMQYVNGAWRFTEGMLGLDANIGYKYNGNTVVYVVPVTYSFGGSVGAGIEGVLTNLDVNNFTPQIEGYINARISGTIGGAIGISCLNVCNPSGTATLNMKKAITNEYLKTWVDGSAKFTLLNVGPWKVLERTLAQGTYLIYETGNPNGLIKDNNVNLMSLDNIYASYDLNSSYQPVDRTENAEIWLGDIDDAELLSTEYANKDIKILSENVYFGAEPMIDNIGGKTVMVWIADNEDRDTYNKDCLVYSIYNEADDAWSEPVPIADDGTIDSYPHFKDGYIVWQNNNSLMNENTTLAEYMADCDICVAKFNGESFDEPICVTDNDVMDSRPTVCAKDDSIEIVWVTNTENDILGTSGKNTIKHLTLGGTEKNIVSDINAVTDLAIGYMGDELNIAYSYDEDNDLSTIEDRDIYIYSNEVTKKLTDDEVINSNPQFSGNKIYWYEGNNIYYTDNLTDKYNVFEEFKIGTDMFCVDTNSNGDTSIWWVNSEENSTEIYTAVFEEDKWSEAIKITDMGGNIKAPYGILTDSGEMVVGFNSYVLTEDEMSANLCTVKVIPAYDISLNNAEYNETNLIAGEEFLITLNVKNSGEKEIEGFKILLSQNGTVINEYEFTDILKAGAESEITVNYSVPTDMVKSEIEISAQILQEEYQTDNNSIKITLGNANPVISELKVYEIEDEVKICSTIVNKGFDDSDEITLNLRENSESGEILKTETVSALSIGKMSQVDFSVDAYSLKYDNGAKQLYVTLESDEDIIYSDYVVIEEREIEENYQQLIPLVSYDEEEKTLNINAIVKNTTQENKDFMMIFCVYDGERLVGCYSKEGTVRKCNETAVDGYIALNEYNENYTVATILVDGFENMMPLCSNAVYGN